MPGPERQLTAVIEESPLLTMAQVRSLLKRLSGAALLEIPVLNWTSAAAGLMGLASDSGLGRAVQVT